MSVDLDALWRVIEARPATKGTVRTHGTGCETAEGEILVAVDETGARALLFPAGAEDVIASDTSTQVHLARRTLRWDGGEGDFIAVTCNVDRLIPVFTTLAEDLLDAAQGAARPGLEVRRVLDEWRELLARVRGPLLGREALVGIISELLTVRDVVRHDPARNIMVWTGPRGAVHDLRSDARALEVKGTLAREALHVEVHGVLQLEHPPEGTLHLVLHRLEEDAAGDLSLPTLVQEVLDLGVNRNEFVSLLSEANYDPAEEEYYAARRFRLVERRVYAVDDTFPRVVPASFILGGSPPGVLLIRYTVDLSGAFPVPLAMGAADAVLTGFAAPE